MWQLAGDPSWREPRRASAMPQLDLRVRLDDGQPPLIGTVRLNPDEAGGVVDDPQAGEIVLAAPVEYLKHRNLLLAGADRGPDCESGQCDGGEDQGPAIDVHASAPVGVSLEWYRLTGDPVGGTFCGRPVQVAPRSRKRLRRRESVSLGDFSDPTSE